MSETGTVEAGRTAARGRYADALRVRDFRLLVVSMLVDQIGSWAYAVVVASYVFGRTGSALAVTAVFSARWITTVVLSGYAGVLADRYSRTTVMTVSALG